MAYVAAMGPIDRLEALEGLEEKYQTLLLCHQQNYSLEVDHLLQLFRFDFLMKQDILREVSISAAYEKYSHCLAGARQYLLNTDTWGVYELRLFARVAISMDAPLLWRCLQLAIKKVINFLNYLGIKIFYTRHWRQYFQSFAFFKNVSMRKKHSAFGVHE